MLGKDRREEKETKEVDFISPYPSALRLWTPKFCATLWVRPFLFATQALIEVHVVCSHSDLRCHFLPI
jgi:hypothetical protein